MDESEREDLAESAEQVRAEGEPDAEGLGPELKLFPNDPWSPRVRISEILRWADAHHEATGKWPRRTSGVVRGAGFPVSWANVEGALRSKRRSAAERTTVAQLLFEHRGAVEPPNLSVEQILEWADAEHAATGEWPKCKPTKVLAAPHENWKNINNVLRLGCRSLPGGITLLDLLAQHRAVPDQRLKQRLSVAEILKWAESHRAATGHWPMIGSGEVRDAPFNVTWCSINSSLMLGRRGLPAGLSLRKLLAQHFSLPERNEAFAKRKRTIS